jgi:hypothetical protein
VGVPISARRTKFRAAAGGWVRELTGSTEGTTKKHSIASAPAALGEKRIVDLSPKDVYARRLTVGEGHRFEATQALRQLLNRAVAWGLLDSNPAKRGVPNPQRWPKEKRPFESWVQIEAIAAQLGPVYGPMVIFGAATGLSALGAVRA